MHWIKVLEICPETTFNSKHSLTQSPINKVSDQIHLYIILCVTMFCPKFESLIVHIFIGQTKSLSCSVTWPATRGWTCHGWRMAACGTAQASLLGGVHVCDLYPQVYKGMVSAALTIRKQEGLTAFYRGSVPALTTVAPQMGLQFGFYALFTATWNTTFGQSTSNRPG